MFALKRAVVVLAAASVAVLAGLDHHCRELVAEKLYDAILVAMLAVSWKLMWNPGPVTVREAGSLARDELVVAIVGGTALALILSAVFLVCK